MDIHRFIAEIRKRRGIWNLHSTQYKDRIFTEKLWIQVAKIMRVSVETCKRKWRNLRDAYHAEVRRSERRKKKDKLLGFNFDKNNYKSKWAYFDDLEFMRSFKRRSCLDEDYESTNSNSVEFEDNYSTTDYNNSATFNSDFQHDIDIKMEPNDDDLLGDDSHKEIVSLSDKKRREFVTDDDAEMANEMNFEEFENITMQHDAAKTPEPKQLSAIQNINATRHSILTANDIHCKCERTTERDHFHFAEYPAPVEQKIITSTKQDLADSNKLKYIGDSDFNFLVSFLPHIKEMNTLQNLQFRAKMSEVVLNILAPTITGQTARKREQLVLTENCK